MFHAGIIALPPCLMCSPQTGDHKDHGAAHRGCQQRRLRGLRVSPPLLPLSRWAGKNGMELCEIYSKSACCPQRNH